MKILLTGPEGQIGWELARVLPSLGDVVPLDRHRLDLSRPGEIARAVQETGPQLIVNAAGYTAVDQAEREPDLARLVNGEAVGVLAEQAREVGALLVHYSTDYVFDGGSDRAYVPSDPTGPLNAYGESKLEGERRIAESGARALVLRASWVYSTRRTNFLLSMIRQASSRPELRIVDDQRGCPTPARVIARATAEAIASGAAEEGPLLAGREGIYHVASHGVASWFDFASAIFELAPIDDKPRLVPITTADYPTPAARPRFSALSCESFETSFGVTLPGWREALAELMQDQSPFGPEAVASGPDGKARS